MRTRAQCGRLAPTLVFCDSGRPTVIGAKSPQIGSPAVLLSSRRSVATRDLLSLTLLVLGLCSSGRPADSVSVGDCGVPGTRGCCACWGARPEAFSPSLLSGVCSPGRALTPGATAHYQKTARAALGLNVAPGTLARHPSVAFLGASPAGATQRIPVREALGTPGRMRGKPRDGA